MRRFLAIAVTALSLVLLARSSQAQYSNPGPSGGSSCVQTRTEVSAPSTPSTVRPALRTFFSHRTLSVLRSAPMLALWRRGLL